MNMQFTFFARAFIGTAGRAATAAVREELRVE
jgi:hypothetical protein